MYTLSHIKTFVRVVELNNFSAAARELNLTVAAVSKHVSQLEQELNVQLLVRTTRKIKLTEIGHQYYLQCQNVLRALNQADAVIAQTQESPSGKVRVKSERYFAAKYIIPKLGEFHQQYPDVQIELDSTERVPEIGSENLDVVFGRSIHDPDNIASKTVSTTRYALCASPEYLKEHGTPSTPRELINHKFLSHSMRVPNDRLSFGKKEQVYIKPILFLNDSDALLNLAIRNVGFTKLQHYVVADAIDKGLLVEILQQHSTDEIPVKVFYEPSKYLQTRVKCFVDFICDTLPDTM